MKKMTKLDYRNEIEKMVNKVFEMEKEANDNIYFNKFMKATSEMQLLTHTYTDFDEWGKEYANRITWIKSSVNKDTLEQLYWITRMALDSLID